MTEIDWSQLEPPSMARRVRPKKPRISLLGFLSIALFLGVISSMIARGFLVQRAETRQRQEDLAALQGVWWNDDHSTRWTINAAIVRIDMGILLSEPWLGRIHLDVSNRSPGKITIYPYDELAHEHFIGIYRIESDRICIRFTSSGSGPRPDSFDRPLHGHQREFVLIRVEP